MAENTAGILAILLVVVILIVIVAFIIKKRDMSTNTANLGNNIDKSSVNVSVWNMNNYKLNIRINNRPYAISPSSFFITSISKDDVLTWKDRNGSFHKYIIANSNINIILIIGTKIYTNNSITNIIRFENNDNNDHSFTFNLGEGETVIVIPKQTTKGFVFPIGTELRFDNSQNIIVDNTFQTVQIDNNTVHPI